MKIIVLCPHFAPDTAPTGTVMTGIVEQLALHGHDIHVVTALPWYRGHQVEVEWQRPWHAGGLMQTEQTDWGTITRVSPFAGADKRNIARRAIGFVGFSALAGVAGVRAGGWLRRADVVLAMSPPITLGLTGWMVGLTHRAPLVFNIQDIFPDAAVRTGAISNRRLIAVASWLERSSYRLASLVTVLSDDMADNVRAKLSPSADPLKTTDDQGVVVIPNFVDTEAIRPISRDTEYRRERNIGDQITVLYAGNVGYSQSLDLIVAAARARPDLAFIINGDGSARHDIDRAAADLPNLHISGYQPIARLNEVLASGDIHVVPLRRGLGDVSVPSKTYSSLASGRPVVAAIDPGTEIPRLLAEAGAGIAVEPDNPAAFIAAIGQLANDAELRHRMGESGRRWVVAEASLAAVGVAYDTALRRVRASVGPGVSGLMPRISQLGARVRRVFRGSDHGTR